MAGTSLTVIPAYGRDYKSKAEVQEAYDKGQDFIIQDFFSGSDGRAVSKREVDAEGITLNVRYDRLTKQFAPVQGKPDIIEPTRDKREDFEDALDRGDLAALEDIIGDGDIFDYI